jgi:hypothetical protein
MKIGMAAAVYIANDEHFNMARETFESARTVEHELVWSFAINHLADQYRPWFEERGEVWETGENNVAKAWNGCVERLLRAECRYVFVPNLDILFKHNCIDRLVAFCEANPQYILVTAGPSMNRDIDSEGENENVLPYPAFSLFVVDGRLPEKIGWFDEGFKGAYNEDLDMHYRILLAGEQAVVYGGARFWHEGSGTIKNDPELRSWISAAHARNDRYFVEKWGRKPRTSNPEHTSGMFTIPFNGAARP